MKAIRKMWTVEVWRVDSKTVTVAPYWVQEALERGKFALDRGALAFLNGSLIIGGGNSSNTVAHNGDYLIFDSGEIYSLNSKDFKEYFEIVEV